MQIYDTYIRKKKAFVPLVENQISMYVCGPTVYDYIHIGNARPVIFFDVVRRYFEALGFDVNYVSNITDVDDKIINKAVAENVSEQEISERYLAQYLQDCISLGALPVSAMPKVTETMDEIIAFIEELVTNDFAYEVNGDVYFRIHKVKDYGQLSGKKVDDLISGARVEENTNKENPLDFTLWKNTKVGITWDSPWGAGRPGWHTECVVMINEAFNGPIDIHGGGSDLQFPHHENEIAQSCCSANHNIANFWMHVGRLGLGDEKMSKSIGNVILVKDLLKEWDRDIFRLFMLSTHYRQPINYTNEVLESSKKEWQKIVQSYNSLHLYLDMANAFSVEAGPSEIVKDIVQRFNEAMDDDFNTANAITQLYALVKEINKVVRSKGEVYHAKALIEAISYMFNVLGFSYEKAPLTEAQKELYRQWEAARENKDFQKADHFRDQLKGSVF